MKEIQIVIKIKVMADDRDKELIDEAVFEELTALIEERDLNYSYKVLESDDDEEEIEELEEEELEF